LHGGVLDLSRLSPEQPYQLAISGGRDSVCLLHLLLENGFRNLHLVHLNHQLRGEESDADAAFVRALAEKHSLPLTLQGTDVAEASQREKESLETAARHARHHLFAQVANKTGVSSILLAHHAEDQAETILFNLLRGSGGLKGISACQEIHVHGQSLILLRPLLETRRCEIDTYLTQHEIAFRDDHSNLELTFTRNRLRHEALPLLQEILARDPVPALAKAEQVTRDHEEIVAALLSQLDLLDPQGRLFLPKLRDLPAVLQKAALTEFLRTHHTENLSQALISDALTLIPPDGPPKLNLPGNRFLRRKESRLFLDD
jgi:tRNA(Ile)-lysidine synthase